MKFSVASTLRYRVLMPSTFIFNIQVSQSTGQRIVEESLNIEPYVEPEAFTSPDGMVRFIIVHINQPTTFTISYNAVVDINHKIFDNKRYLEHVPVAQLDTDVIPYLFPSRYCPSDKLYKLAQMEFGHIKNPYEQVVAITDWVSRNVQYQSGSSDASTSAIDTLTGRTGVCRDFAHLGIALCRALSIPARYFTGYAHKLSPPDFHACFEAYIGNDWLFFDATKLVPSNGMVKIANGRDAADASFACIFGNAVCEYMTVECEATDPKFKPKNFNGNKARGLSYQ